MPSIDRNSTESYSFDTRAFIEETFILTTEKVISVIDMKAWK